MILLLAVVAKVNKADVDGETALMYASSNGHLDVVSLGCPAVSIYLKPNICLSDCFGDFVFRMFMGFDGLS